MKYKVIFSFCLLAIIAFAPKALPFELQPEKRSLIKTDLATSPSSDISTEYGADLLSFEPSDEQILLAFENPRLFQILVGSLGGNHFNFVRRIKLEEQLTENQKFRFSSLVHQNFHQSHESGTLEYDHQISDKWSLGLFGEVFYLKSDNDVGLTASYFSGENSSHSIFHSWQNYSQNERSSSDDRFQNGFHPHSLSYQYLYRSQSRFKKLVLRLDPFAKWSFPSSDNKFIFASRLLQWIDIKRDSSSKISSSLKIQMKDNLVEKKDLSSNLLESLAEKQLRLQYRKGFTPMKSWVSENHWAVDFHQLSHETLTKKSTTTYLSLLISMHRKNTSWSHQLIATSYSLEGDKTLLAMKTKEDYNLRFDSRYRVPLKNNNFHWDWGLSFDMDRFGSDDTWEGGFSQISYVF